MTASKGYPQSCKHFITLLEHNPITFHRIFRIICFFHSFSNFELAPAASRSFKSRFQPLSKPKFNQTLVIYKDGFHYSFRGTGPVGGGGFPAQKAQEFKRIPAGFLI